MPDSKVVETPRGAVEITEQDGPEPTVVFVSGISGSNAIWREVFEDIGRTNAVFTYHRPGYGETPNTELPRDGRTIVENLRALLAERGIAQPVILVGHSAGGLYSQIFARRYPAEVAGMVLLDPVHPTQFEGEQAEALKPTFFDLFLVLLDLIGPIADEVRAMSKTGQQVLASPPLSDTIPTIILVARDASGTKAAAFNNAKRADYQRLYPNAAHRFVESGHSIQADRPELVIEAIREVLAQESIDAAGPLTLYRTSP